MSVRGLAGHMYVYPWYVERVALFSCFVLVIWFPHTSHILLRFCWVSHALIVFLSFCGFFSISNETSSLIETDTKASYYTCSVCGDKI